MGGCVVAPTPTKQPSSRPASPLHYSKTVPITTIPAPMPVNHVQYRNPSPFR